MNKPLVLSTNYQFATSTNGQLQHSFFRELSSRGFLPKIICSDLFETLAETPPNVYVVHARTFERYIGGTLRRYIFPDLAYVMEPDYFSWRRSAFKEGLRLINSGKCDYIHSFSHPESPHFVAQRLKEKTGLPWVAQFYDPWYDNTYQPYKTKYFKGINYKEEEAVALHADIIIHSHQGLADRWAKRYGSEVAKKVKVVPFNFSIPGARRICPHVQGKPIIISHIGNLYLSRTTEVFINAVDRLLREHPDYRDRLKVNYIGNVTNVERTLIPAKGLTDVFNLVGRVSESECMKYYEQSDIFLTVDAANGSDIFFPSKILKYFYYEKPILGVTPSGSPTEYELQAAGHQVFRNDDVEGICRYLETAINDYSSLNNFKHDYWMRFSPQSVVDCYLDAIKSLDKQ